MEPDTPSNRLTMTTYSFNAAKMELFKKRFGNKKLFFQTLMPVRGPGGFRKLDYEYARTLDAEFIIRKLVDHGFDGFGLVAKDTDGALVSNTNVGWNPTGRDLVKEFEELCQKYNFIFILSITNFNDAYRGWYTTDGYKNDGTVSVHIKGRKNGYNAGTIAVHNEGEMRVDLPDGKTLGDLQKQIPFLTDLLDDRTGKSRAARGHGYIPRTAFHCPRSEHVEYMLDIVRELAGKYQLDGIFADYIRYDGSYTDLCGCERCRTAFAERNPGGKVLSKAWHEFREDNIADFGKRFNDAIKGANEELVTGWFNLPGPDLFTRNRIAQNARKLAPTMDCVVPMIYPYLMGTSDDGRRWRVLADLAHWFSKKIMVKKYLGKQYGDTPVVTVTNSVECNAEEMLISCREYDYGLGIALFKYFGTSDAQWEAARQYGDLIKAQVIGDEPPSDETIRQILMRVYEKYPPKNPHLLKWKPRQTV